MNISSLRLQSVFISPRVAKSSFALEGGDDRHAQVECEQSAVGLFTAGLKVPG